MPAPLMTIGQLIDRSWDYYHERFSAFMSISIWSIITAILAIITAILLPTVEKMQTGELLSASEIFATILKLFNGLFVTPILGLWVFIALAIYTRTILARRRKPIKESLIKAWKNFFSVLWVSILIFLILIGGIFIGLGPSIPFLLLTIWTGSRILLSISYFLMIVGTIVAFVINVKWTVQFTLAPIAVITDGIKGIEALKKSRNIVKGRFWKILFRLVVPKVLAIGIGLIILYILFLISAAALGFLPNISISLAVVLVVITKAILPTLVTIIIQPFPIIADVLLYDSLRGQRS